MSSKNDLLIFDLSTSVRSRLQEQVNFNLSIYLQTRCFLPIGTKGCNLSTHNYAEILVYIMFRYNCCIHSNNSHVKYL